MRRFVALVALLAATPLAAQMVSIPLGGPHKEKPSPNATLLGSPAGIAAAVAMRGRPVAMKSLDENRHPAEVLAFLGLPLGGRVLEVMADTGYYSEIIGEAVGPNGKVTAPVGPTTMKTPDSRKAMIELVGRVPNIAIVAADPGHAQFAASSFDFVLLHLAWHALYGEPAGPGDDPAVFLRKLYAAVRPGGTVGVIDHVADPGGDGRDAAARLHRVDPAVVRADFVRAGFVFDGESALLRTRRDDHAMPAADMDPDAATDRFVFRFVKPE